MTRPVCAKCGNDGSKGGLYLTVDAQWIPSEARWELRGRDDAGGKALDCLSCDHQTPWENGFAGFPAKGDAA